MTTPALMFIEVGPDYARKLKCSPHVQMRMQKLAAEHNVTHESLAFVVFQGQHYIRVTTTERVNAVHYHAIWE